MQLPGSTSTEDRPAASQPADAKHRGRVSARAVTLALALAVINDYWLVQLEVVRYSFATYAAPFYNVVFTLLLLTGANHLLKRYWPRVAFSQVEMLTVYVMLSITSAVCSVNMMQILVSVMGYPFFYQNADNGWKNLFLDRLPHWLTVSNQESLRGFYYGGTTLYNPHNYLPWVGPVLWWSAFCFVLLFTMLCLNSILRKQWVEAERLTFPVIMLPLEMTEDSGSFFRNRYFWLAFGIAGSLTLLAGINYLYPNVPCLQISRVNYGRFISQMPWRAMGSIMVGFYFWAIGLAFLMPLELSFSCWVFFWLIRFEVVGAQAFGWNALSSPGGGFENAYPYLNSQSYGAYLGFFVMTMWTSRRYLGRVFRTAILGTREEDESREAISYRAAVIGTVLGALALCLFARAMGMSAWIIGAFFLLYFVFAAICGRIRAELGFPTHDMHFMPPQYALMTAAGSDKIGAQNFVGFSMLWWFNRTYASHPSPHQLEAFKIAERTSTPARQMFKATLVAAALAMPIGFWMLLHVYYKLGGGTSHMEEWALGYGEDFCQDLTNRLNNPFPPNVMAMWFVGVGFVGSMLLGWMRVRYLWFPLHPLAYAIGNSWGVQQIWLPLLIGSTCKFFILKFGGLPTYRRALPFFFGLILGEIAIGGLWTIIGILMGVPTYDFWPGKPR